VSVLVDNDSEALALKLSYAALQTKYPKKFGSALMGAVAGDRHWVMLSEHLVSQYMPKGGVRNSALARLTDNVFMSITVLKPFMKNIVVSKYETAEDARQAFVATGSMFRIYKGQLTVDGGATDCAPLFKDEARKQLVVTLTKSGLPMSMLAMANLDEAKKAMIMGQDDIVKFLNGEQVDSLEILDERKTWGKRDC
jgi:hypothetical protein